MSATGSTVFVVEVQALQKLLAEKEAEIERLNGELLDQIDRCHWLINENESLKSLMGELVAALSHYALLNDLEKSLLQRARAATA